MKTHEKQPGILACAFKDPRLLSDREIVAVLDIDSVVKDRFSAEDAEGLEAFVRLIEEKISWE